ncbi:hypothetical protein RBB84_20000 [Rhodococcus sp. D-6]|uniref:Uncharacterized protein n=1 Tax=Rhodococcus sp. D-6 TaxID=1387842 RepID=A0AAU7UUW6_9NOCA
MSPHQPQLLRLRAAAAAYRFRESLFALPAAIVAVGVILAEVSAYLDRTINPGATAGWGCR